MYRPRTLYLLLASLLCLLPAGCGTRGDTADPTVGQQRESLLFWSQAEREARFPKMATLFPASRVAAGGTVHRLPKGAPLLPAWTDGTTLPEYMRRHHITGVMVLQHGRVRLERFAEGFGPDTRWTSFSVAKSVTSTLLGISLEDGYIDSLEDRLARYIPELEGSAYADVTVRELLTMTSGVRWNEDYADPQSDVAQMYNAPCEGTAPHILPYLGKLPRQWPPGTHFNYNTAETDLLGVLVQRATGQSLAAYLSRSIWQPYGMAADAFWLKDECSGRNTGGSGLQATLGDYARFGQFMLEGGRIDGKPVIAKAWLDEAFRVQEPVDDPNRGYGYLWWIDRDGGYAAVGIFGQLVYVDSARDLVIAQIAAWPAAYNAAEVAARRAFVAAVKRAVDADDALQPAVSHGGASGD